MVCSSKLLSKATMILFLNKCDLLKRKLKSGVQIKTYLPSFGERSNDVGTVVKCTSSSIIPRSLCWLFVGLIDLREKFKEVLKEHSPGPRSSYFYATSVVVCCSYPDLFDITDDLSFLRIPNPQLRRSKLVCSHPQSLGVIINNLPSLVKDSITREFLKNADLMWGLRVPFLADTAHLSPAYHLLFYISIRVAFRYFLTLGPLKLHAPFLYILYFPLFLTRLLQGWPLAVCLSVLCTTKVAFSLSVGPITRAVSIMYLINRWRLLLYSDDVGSIGEGYYVGVWTRSQGYASRDSISRFTVLSSPTELSSFPETSRVCMFMMMRQHLFRKSQQKKKNFIRWGMGVTRIERHEMGQLRRSEQGRDH